jgi:hypothetical protein
MNVYEAILKAADHIETNPKLFNYSENRIPDCGTPGCALGWIGHFLGLKGDYETVLQQMGLHHLTEFSADRMDVVGGVMSFWRHNAQACAKTLRLYAQEYHAPTKVASPPDWNAMAAKWTVGDDVRSQEVAA